MGAAISGWAASLAVAATSVGFCAPHPEVPAKDLFTGTITAATGKFKPAHGKNTIELTAPSSREDVRQLTLSLHSRRCAKANHCLQLRGKLNGTLTAKPQKIPDTGISFTIRASGAITPLRSVSAAGTIHGTGFIHRGYETLHLILTARGGTITLDARSAQVPEFTSP